MNVVASWHVYGTDDPVGPLDVWLIDEGDRAIHITTGSDWCLVVETSEPYAGYDMGDSGHITVGALDGTTPFEGHIGESVLAARSSSRIQVMSTSGPPWESGTGVRPGSNPVTLRPLRDPARPGVGTQGRAGLADLRPAEATAKTYDPHPRPVVVGYETGWVSAGERGPARHPTART
ncbi:hypothetical protein [Actinacidiphila glaucinigra]|uniref:hypothetical protein n=1 Tax=Actinacidiphila glaucinigra TaxID=235986 RepID=UPI0036ED7471